jgi:hypothetical protein
MSAWIWRAARACALAGAVLVWTRVRQQVPWVPLPYLASVFVLPVVGWRIVRWRTGPGLLRWSALGAVIASLGALAPVPWMTANLQNPPGTAWRLDGRLTIEGEIVDPPGSWYWLTVGRPPLVAELVYSWLFDGHGADDLRRGSTKSRPEFNEPAAAAVGLRRAGREISFGLMVEATGPASVDFPEHAVVTRLNGVPLIDRDHWVSALNTLGQRNAFTTIDGEVVWFDGDLFPYRRVDIYEIPLDEVDAEVGGPLANSPPGRWWRGLSLGGSHGLMVALLAYMHESGESFGEARSVAGTGGIRGDGSVSPIGGLRSKATAARRAGAQVLLFPAEQASELADFDPGAMRLVPVSTLDDAITALRS